MFKNTSKVAVVAGGTLAVVGIAGAAYAASLSFTSDKIASGTAVVAACDAGAPGSIVASYVPTPATSATPSPTTGIVDTGSGFVAKTISITGVPAACASKTLYVSVSNGSSVLGNGVISIPAGTTAASTLTPTLTSTSATTPVMVKDITSISILIPNS